MQIPAENCLITVAPAAFDIQFSHSLYAVCNCVTRSAHSFSSRAPPSSRIMPSWQMASVRYSSCKSAKWIIFIFFAAFKAEHSTQSNAENVIIVFDSTAKTISINCGIRSGHISSGSLVHTRSAHPAPEAEQTRRRRSSMAVYIVGVISAGRVGRRTFSYSKNMINFVDNRVFGSWVLIIVASIIRLFGCANGMPFIAMRVMAARGFILSTNFPASHRHHSVQVPGTRRA